MDEFPTSALLPGKQRAAAVPKPLEIPVRDDQDVVAPVVAVTAVTRAETPSEDVEAARTPPTRSPGHQLASGTSEPSPPDSDDKDGTATRTTTTALPSPAFTIPTPRGVEQMSPDVVQEPRRQPMAPRIVIDGKTTVQCCFCGRNSQGSAAMKRHIYASCQAKPKVADKMAIDAIIEEYLVKNYNTETPAVEKTRQRVDPDETEEDSDSDDIGRRSDEARIKQKNASAAYLDEDDEEEDVREDMARRMALAASADVEEEQTAPPATMTTTMPGKRERRPSAKLASASNGALNITAPKIAPKTTPPPMDAEVLTCAKCGVFTTLKPVGLKIHMTRCKASVPAPSTEQPLSSKMVQKQSHATTLTKMNTTRKRRKCLLSDDQACAHVSRNAAELVAHMLDHGVEVVFGFGAKTGTIDGDEDVVEVPEVVSRGRMTTTTTLKVHWAARKCTMCSHEKFDSREELCAHYLNEHGCEVGSAMKTPTSAAIAQPQRSSSLTRPQREKRTTLRYARESESPPPPKSPTPTAQVPPLPTAKVLIGAERNCEYCSFNSGSFRMLKTHYNNVHGIDVAVSETTPMETTAMVVQHTVQNVAMSQRETVIKPGDQACSCHCGREFPSIRSLKAHTRWCKPSAARGVVESGGAATEVEDEVQETMCEEIGSDGEDVSQPSETAWTILKTETTCPHCRDEFDEHKTLIHHMHKEHGIKRLNVVEAMPRSEAPGSSKKRVLPVTSVQRDTFPSTKRISTRHNNDNVSLAVAPASNELVVTRLASGETVSADVVNQLMAKLEQQHSRITALERTCNAMKTLVDPFNAGAKIQRIHIDEQSSSSGFAPITTFGRLVWLTNVCAANLELPVEEQMQEALEYLVQLLVRAGTDVLHLISIKIYLSDNRDMGPIVKVWDDFFTKLGIPPNDRPVRNTVISHGFSKHRLMKVELHGHAVLPGPNETALAKGVP